MQTLPGCALLCPPQDDTTITPLLMCCVLRQWGLVPQLLQRGADPNARLVSPRRLLAMTLVQRGRLGASSQWGHTALRRTRRGA